MKFIDCHTHPCFGNDIFEKAALESKVFFNLEGFFNEMDVAGVEKAVSIGVDLRSNKLIAQMAKKSDRIIPVFGVNLSQKSNFMSYLKEAKKALKKKEFSGLKIFLGYDHIEADSKTLEPFYKLAETHEIPVIFHTGDTLRAVRQTEFLKYTHPLAIDEVAVKHPSVNFLIAHAGNPWTEDVAEIIYKNDNCYADVSGWFLNSIEPHYARLMREKLQDMVAFAGEEKLMFGSDWPLINMNLYTKFVISSLNASALKKIVYSNAASFWGI